VDESRPSAKTGPPVLIDGRLWVVSGCYGSFSRRCCQPGFGNGGAALVATALPALNELPARCRSDDGPSNAATWASRSSPKPDKPSLPPRRRRWCSRPHQRLTCHFEGHEVGVFVHHLRGRSRDAGGRAPVWVQLQWVLTLLRRVRGACHRPAPVLRADRPRALVV
jgi:hypothetical protein